MKYSLGDYRRATSGDDAAPRPSADSLNLASTLRAQIGSMFLATGTGTFGSTTAVAVLLPACRPPGAPVAARDAPLLETVSVFSQLVALSAAAPEYAFMLAN